MGDLWRDCSMDEPVEEDEERVSAWMESLPPARPSGSSENSLSPSDMTWRVERRVVREWSRKVDEEGKESLARRDCRWVMETG